jgi:hypothetical protein
MAVDDAVGWLGTYSGLVTAPAGERAASLARARAALLPRANAAGMIEIPMQSACWRADRAGRPRLRTGNLWLGSMAGLYV